MASRKWTEEEVNFIKNNPKMTVTDIAKHLNRTHYAVALRIKKYQILRNAPNNKSPKRIKHYQQKELDFIMQHYSIMKNEEISKKLNMSVPAICYIAQKFNLRKNINFVKYFDIPCYHEYAYVLGFLFADGYFNIKQGMICVVQARDATDIADTMHKVFPWKQGIRTEKRYPDNEYIYFRSSSRAATKYLVNKFQIDKKSYFLSQDLINFIISGGDECVKLFLRGVIDGDGHITRNLVMVTISSRIDFDWSSLTKLFPNEVNYYIKKYISKKGKYSVLKMNKLDSYRFLKYIYTTEDDYKEIGLQRKRLRAYKLIDTVENKKRVFT